MQAANCCCPCCDNSRCRRRRQLAYSWMRATAQCRTAHVRTARRDAARSQITLGRLVHLVWVRYRMLLQPRIQDFKLGVKLQFCSSILPFYVFHPCPCLPSSSLPFFRFPSFPSLPPSLPSRLYSLTLLLPLNPLQGPFPNPVAVRGLALWALYFSRSDGSPANKRFLMHSDLKIDHYLVIALLTLICTSLGRTPVPPLPIKYKSATVRFLKSLWSRLHGGHVSLYAFQARSVKTYSISSVVSPEGTVSDSSFIIRTTLVASCSCHCKTLQG